MAPCRRTLICVTFGSQPLAFAVGTYVQVVPPSFEKSRLSVVLLRAVYVYVRPLTGVPFMNTTGPEPAAPASRTSSAVLAGIASTMASVLLSTLPEPWFVILNVYNSTAPGMLFGLVVLLTGSDST